LKGLLNKNSISAHFDDDGTDGEKSQRRWLVDDSRGSTIGVSTTMCRGTHCRFLALLRKTESDPALPFDEHIDTAIDHVLGAHSELFDKLLTPCQIRCLTAKYCERAGAEVPSILL
jgi:hypothetical protein